jgi:hypothetical protein
MTESHPRPSHLGDRGGRFWDAVSGGYKLRPDELIVLEDACREIDLIDRLEEELRTASLVVTGGYEQEVANPLITEIRQHRGVVARLVNQLKLPDGSAAEKPSAAEAARKAANARWGNAG